MPRTGVLALPEYGVWSTMIQRCTNPKDAAYKNYGAKGVSVCDRWRQSFQAFYADMGARPTPRHTVDRIESTGNYEPSNCRWATRTEQNRNRSSCRPLTIEGRTLLMTDWAKERGISVATISKRLRRGWSDSRAVMTPPAPATGAALAPGRRASSISTSTSIPRRGA